MKTTPSPKTKLASEQDTDPGRQSLLQDSKVFSFERDAQQLIFAPDRTDIVAVISQADTGRDLQIARYTLSANGQSLPTGRPTPFASGSPVRISRDAELMTRLVKFMNNTTLQVWSFKESGSSPATAPPTGRRASSAW